MKIKGTKNTTKGHMSKHPDSTTKISTNLGVLLSGTYRARKMINGVAYSQNFSNKKKALAWLNSL